MTELSALSGNLQTLQNVTVASPDNCTSPDFCWTMGNITWTLMNVTETEYISKCK